jgi:UDPglucose 6-dehydrogenase/GDP-mannose 6-dehydrogenase
VTGAGLAAHGHRVVCADLDRVRPFSTNRALASVAEPRVREVLRRCMRRKLRATGDVDGAIRGSDVSFITVGAPFDGCRQDLRQVRRAAEHIGAALARTDAYHVVVVKTTVEPGTTEDVVCPIIERTSGRRVGRDFGIAVEPEFLSLGAAAAANAVKPDQIVLGTVDARTLAILEQLYEGFPNVRRIRTNIRTADMIKYASSALRAGTANSGLGFRPAWTVGLRVPVRWRAGFPTTSGRSSRTAAIGAAR